MTIIHIISLPYEICYALARNNEASGHADLRRRGSNKMTIYASRLALYVSEATRSLHLPWRK